MHTAHLRFLDVRLGNGFALKKGTSVRLQVSVQN